MKLHQSLPLFRLNSYFITLPFCCFFFRLMSQLNESSVAFDEFWLQHQKKLELSLQLCQFEHNFQQVTHFTINYTRTFKHHYPCDNSSRLAVSKLIIMVCYLQVSAEMKIVTNRLAAFSHVGISQAHTEHLLKELTDQEDISFVSLLLLKLHTTTDYTSVACNITLMI